MRISGTTRGIDATRPPPTLAVPLPRRDSGVPVRPVSVTPKSTMPREPSGVVSASKAGTCTPAEARDARKSASTEAKRMFEPWALAVNSRRPSGRVADIVASPETRPPWQSPENC